MEATFLALAHSLMVMADTRNQSHISDIPRRVVGARQGRVMQGRTVEAVSEAAGALREEALWANTQPGPQFSGAPLSRRWFQTLQVYIQRK